MSLYGSLFSGVTALNAQSRALGGISENISNVNTVGYKSTTNQFSSLVSGSDSSSVGGVRHVKTQNLTGQGVLQQTTNQTDLSVTGAGFFVVNDNILDGVPVGQTSVTRAGHFALDSEQNLVNASGLGLLGWKLDSDSNFIDAANNPITPDPTSNADLLPVSVREVSFSSQATRNIDMQASFPAQMTVGDIFQASAQTFDELSSSHSLQFEFTKSEHIAFDGTLDQTVGGNFQINDIATPAALENGNLSTVTALDLEFEGLGTDVDGVTTWRVTIGADNGTPSPTTLEVAYDVEGDIVGDPFRQIDVEWAGGLSALDSIIALDFSGITFATGTGGAAVTDPPEFNESGPVMKLDVTTSNADDVFVSGAGTFVQFNQNGTLATPSELEMEINWDNDDSFAANSTMTFNLGEVGTKTGLSLGGETFALSSTSQDGVEFSAFKDVSVDDRGIVFANFNNGTSIPVFQIPLADFNNANGLIPVNGNAFVTSLESGELFLNIPGFGGTGSITPQTLEQSTVDIALEFTNMITTQRAFSSASTVIKTADEMLQELVQLKR